MGGLTQGWPAVLVLVAGVLSGMLGVGGLEDLARPGLRLGVSVIDCLKGLWEDACGRAGLVEPVRRNISYRANGCIAIVEAVAAGEVDVAFGWTAFRHLAPGRIEVMELPEEVQVKRGTGVALLEFSRRPEEAERFMDFLVTPEVRAFYREYGWTDP